MRADLLRTGWCTGTTGTSDRLSPAPRGRHWHGGAGLQSGEGRNRRYPFLAISAEIMRGRRITGITTDISPPAFRPRASQL